MIIDNREAKQIVISGKDDEVLAVISDAEIIEKDGVSVIVDWSLDLSDATVIEQLATPLSTWLKENRNPHTTIVITDSFVRVVSDDISIPISNLELSRPIN